MEALPPELVERVLATRELQKIVGLLRQVCRLWRDILDRQKVRPVTLQYLMAKSLPLLQWARESGAPWSKYTCAEAAASGNLETLQWARANGCPWNSGVCSSAAKHFEVLKWAHANGAPFDEYTCAEAAEHGRLDVLQ
eukprot:m.469562 g.469562  ORF g.469562 m.469562 type:complete len:138 (-) comp28701_c0_seq1:586-999(-)